jgi:hypothetical protein
MKAICLLSNISTVNITDGRRDDLALVPESGPPVNRSAVSLTRTRRDLAARSVITIL